MQLASLSTMWMQGRFRRLNEFMAAAGEAGFHCFELSHIVTPEMLGGLEPGACTITSLHAPAPTTSQGQATTWPHATKR